MPTINPYTKRFQLAIDAANEAQCPATARCLLLIMLHLSEDGKTKTSISALTPYYGGHQSNVVKQLRVLRTKGLISVDEKGVGFGTSNTYGFPFLRRNALFEKPIAPPRAPMVTGAPAAEPETPVVSADDLESM